MKCIVAVFALITMVLASPIQDEALQEFELGNRLFTAAIYRELIRSNSGNLLISPFSVETVLSLAYEGARGQTSAELVRGLYLPNTDEKVQSAYTSILPKLQSSVNDLQLITANKIYLREGAELEDRFRSIAARVYRSAVENVDFSHGAAAANEINMWVERQTNNKIRNLVDQNSINENTVMVLVNTLYLSGRWTNPFADSQVLTDFYRTGEESVKVNSLLLREYVNYYENENLNAQFLELPLQGGNVSLVIVLPRERNGLESLEENILEVLEPQPYRNTLVEVELPRFSIESNIQFLPVLENLGIRQAFGPEADFSGISSTYQDVYISSVIQKSYINVTRNGIEATSASESQKTSMDWPSAYFRANRPFLYYIRNNGIILFSGRYVVPEVRQ